jgi:hypothetical protein
MTSVLPWSLAHHLQAPGTEGGQLANVCIHSSAVSDSNKLL